MRRNIPTFNTNDTAWTFDLNPNTGECQIQKYIIGARRRYNFTDIDMYTAHTEQDTNNRLIEADELFTTEKEAIEYLLQKVSEEIDVDKISLEYDAKRLENDKKALANKEAAVEYFKQRLATLG